MNNHTGIRFVPALLLIFAFMLLLAPATQAQSVRVNWSKKAPFSDYKTYTWEPSKTNNHPFFREDVEGDVKTALSSKGLQSVPASQTPDLIVTYHFLTQESMESETNYMGGGGWGGWGWGGWGMDMGGDGFSNTTEHPITMGILTVDMMDAKTKRLVWRGQATEDNMSKSSKGEDKDASKAIHKMFDHFPPK